MRDQAILLDVMRACRLVLEFKHNLSETQFLEDAKTQSAVLHQLLVLGEAVKRLSGDFRSQHEEVPWRLVAGMRDLLIHHYDTVDLEEVWRVADRDIPQLVQQLEPLLFSETPDKPE